MLLRLIVVLLGLLAAGIVVRTFRALMGRTPRGVRGTSRPALDPEKKVSATWSEISSEGERRGVD